MKIILQLSLLLCSLLLFSSSCKNQQKKEQNAKTQQVPVYKGWDTLEVTSTAYNSVESQTKKGNPTLAAWGDTLRPGMRAIAVSRDLIKMGLTHNTRVKIKGLDSLYRVKDKMNRRWKMKIDIYMGTNIKKAHHWGRKDVTIYVEPEKSDTADT